MSPKDLRDEIALAVLLKGMKSHNYDSHIERAVDAYELAEAMMFARKFRYGDTVQVELEFYDPEGELEINRKKAMLDWIAKANSEA